MKNICLNGLINTAPTQHSEPRVQKMYDGFAPTELINVIESSDSLSIYSSVGAFTTRHNFSNTMLM
jgi:hypothetical protein